MGRRPIMVFPHLSPLEGVRLAPQKRSVSEVPERPVLEENKAVVRRFVDEVVNQRKLSVVDEIVSSDFFDHDAPPGTPTGPEGIRRAVSVFLDAFHDFRVAIEDLVAEGDKVVARATARGTYRGRSVGMAETARDVTFRAIEIFRIVDGKILERWSTAENLSLVQQLGAVLVRDRPNSLNAE